MPEISVSSYTTSRDTIRADQSAHYFTEKKRPFDRFVENKFPQTKTQTNLVFCLG